MIAPAVVLGLALLVTAAPVPAAHADERPVAAAAAHRFGPRRGPVKTVELEQERALTRALEREARLAAARRFLGLPWGAPYGVEMESPQQVELRRQIFYGLAKLTGESQILRVASTVAAPIVDRSLLEIEAQIRERKRATYVDCEELKVSAQHYIAPRAEAAAMSAGALLFAGGTLGPKLLPALNLGDRLFARPNPWPTGIKIGGTF